MADRENALGKKTIIAIIAVIVLLFIAGISVGIFLADKGSSEAVDGNQVADVNQNTDANNTNTENQKNDDNNVNSENKQNENIQAENNNNQTGENSTPDNTNIATKPDTGVQNNVTTPNNNDGTVANNGTTNNNVTANNGETDNNVTNNTEITTGTNVNEVGETTVTRVEEEEKLVSKDFWDWWTPASVLATAASAVSDTIVPTTPDFTVEKFATTKSGENVVYAGENITYTIKVTNNGEKDLNNIEITDKIPENTTFVSFDDAFNIIKGKTVIGENDEVVGVKWIVSVPGHKENEDANSVFVRFTVNVNKMMLVEMDDGEIAEVPTTGTIANTAIANGQESNEEKTAIITSNKTSEITRDGSKVEVAKIGDEITYTIKVTNTGEVDGVTTISDNVPTGTILKENSAEGAIISENNTKLEWKNVTVPAGESVSKTFIVIVDNFDDLTENKITNVATVGGKETDEVEDPIAIDITVTKVWTDGDNQDGLRAQYEVTLTGKIMKEGKEEVVYTDTATLSPETLSKTWSGLAKYSNGIEIIYTVEETTIPEGYEATYSEDGFTITNTHTPEVVSKTVTKVWTDGDNQDGLRAQYEVTLTGKIMKEGKEEVVYTDTATLSPETLSKTWSGLAKYSNGIEIIYTVEETTIPEGYEATYSENGFTITNTHTPEVVSKTVTKVWTDGDNQDGLRAQYGVTLTGKIMKEGEEEVVYTDTATLSPETLSKTWSGLAKYSNGIEIIYTVEETTIPEGYEATYSEDGFTITNTHTPEVVSKTVTKVWTDGDNQDGLRARYGVTLTGKIMKEGKEEVVYTDTATLSPETLSKTWSGLAKYSNGIEIIYTVEETTIPEGYEAIYSEDGFTITNTHTPEVVSKTVTKVWTDGDNQDGLRAQYGVTLTGKIMKEGKEEVVYTDTATLSPETLSKTWSGLAKYSNGIEIIYTVEETTIPEGYEATYSEDGFTITNTHTPEVVSKTVTKVWTDGDNQDGLRAQYGVTLTGKIMKEGKEEVVYTDTATLSPETLSKTWSGLAKYSNGIEIIYTVEETTIPEGYEATYSENGFTITNTHTPEVVSKTVTKVWTDGDNQDGLRAQYGVTLTGKIMKEGEEEVVYTDTATLSPETLSKTWSGLAKYSNGIEIIYTVEETTIPEGYEATYSEDGFTITNTHTPEVVSKTVTKVWTDGDNQDGLRAQYGVTLTGKIMKEGKEEVVYTDTATLSPETLSKTWSGLAKYSNGIEIIYTVEETTIPEGYEATYSEDGFTITNTHTPEVVSKTVTKVWTDGDNQDGLRAQYEVTLTGKIMKEGKEEVVYTDTATLSPETLSKTWSGLAKYSNGIEIIYTVEETTIPEGYEATYSEDGFTITNTHTPEVVSKTVTKVWTDGDNQDGLRAQYEVTLTGKIMKEGKEEVVYTDTATLSPETLSKTWSGLAKYSNGIEIIYTVEETTIPEGYEATYSEDGFTITNTHTPEVVSKTVTKVWTDGDNQDGLRAQYGVTLTGKIMKEGKEEVVYTDTATLSPETLSKTWSGLAKYSNGIEIIYTVEETTIPEGYEATYSENGFTITNTHTPEVVSKTVTKVWTDGDNQDGLRAQYGVTLTGKIMKEGEEEVVYTDTATLSPETLSKTWSGLAKYSNGIEIIYTVEETTIPEGYEATYSEDGFTITNTHTPEVVSKTVTKVWTDGDNQDGLRAQYGVTLTGKIMKEGKEEVVYTDTATLSPETLSKTWSGLAKYSNGIEIIYTVEETTIPEGYEATYSEDGFTITNTHTPTTKNVVLTKIWDDNGNELKKRPGSVTFRINNKNYVLSALKDEDKTTLNEWTLTVKLPINNTDTVSEVPVKGYTTIYGEDGLTVTNQIMQPGKVTINSLKQSSEKINAPMDVVFVLDTSNSMSEKSSRDDENNKAQNMVNAVNNTISNIMKLNPDSRVGIVGYAGWKENNSKDHSEHPSVIVPLDNYKTITGDYISLSGNVINVNDAITKGESRTITGGTYTQAGIKLGAEQLIIGSENKTYTGKTKDGLEYTTTRVPMLVLVTDGVPTYYIEADNAKIVESPNWQQRIVVEGNGSENQVTSDYYYWTIKTAKYYKDEVTKAYYGENSKNKSKVFTIGIGLNENKRAKVMLNPNEDTIDAQLRRNDGLYIKLQENDDNPYKYDYAEASTTTAVTSGELEKFLEKSIFGSLPNLPTIRTITAEETTSRKIYLPNIDTNKEFKLIIGTNTYNTFKEASAYIKGDATSGYYVDLTSVSKTATVEVSYWEIFTGTNS